jgi:DNA oxidative demethylase
MNDMNDLFDAIEPRDQSREVMADGAMLLRGRALPFEADILNASQAIIAEAPFRHMTTPGGYVMSVAMTNCAAAGWVTDRTGYRYERVDPQSGQPWPALPDCFLELAIATATEAGCPDFAPDAYLINRYDPGARLSLHRDKNETSPTRSCRCPWAYRPHSSSAA